MEVGNDVLLRAEETTTSFIQIRTTKPPRVEMPARVYGGWNSLVGKL